MNSSCDRPRRACSAMKRQCRCSIPDDIAPASASSGHMPWMTGHAAAPRRRRLPTCSLTTAAPEEIAGLLNGFSGILQVDGYAAYKALARGHGGDPAGFLSRPCPPQIRQGLQVEPIAVRARGD